MVKKTIKGTFLKGFFIAIIVFLLGLYLGYTLDILRVGDVSDSISEIELDALYYVTSQDYLDTFGENIDNESSCELMQSILSSLSPELSNLGKTLTSFENKNIFSGRDYKILKHKYFLLELRAYTLFAKLKQECGYDFDLILYFYNQRHEASQRQGYILDTLVNIHSDLYVFSFDRFFDEAITHFLNERYNITTAPTLILNEETKFSGFTGLGELNEFLN